MLSLTLVASLLFTLAHSNPITKRGTYIGSTTQNQLSDGTPCRDITIIFARGTSESGNVGTLTGPPFFQAVSELSGGKVAVQGVDYAANVIGFLGGGDSNGSQKMASLVATAKQRCPGTKVVLSGYSQGGQLVHNAGRLLGSTDMNAVQIFGDPFRGRPVENVSSQRTLIICHAFDNICQGGALVLPSHLDYAVDATRAAQFVVQAASG
ncbi:carbohydrate esterase family 5 protein [Pseudocercospora fijiensis CIRAD86]|uniref:Cutinase n=1 Tax=Pseudocercospora fijiensis (strain CIRAD86) TaxID=383855 RepID=M3BAL4_PSEFD|nr:carbohydrate esterase family 5 protein [Pseudocercospora fijiensis CIRAD86]EME86258.1 carbohydrate esterase family 5 protein [Pseudocercospora fijiensis CIRAD86]